MDDPPTDVNSTVSSQRSSMTSLLIWNVSKVLEKNPHIDLQKAIKSTQEKIEAAESLNVKTIVSENPESRHLVCALLAWQEMGHSDADSLYRFIVSQYPNILRKSNTNIRRHDNILEPCAPTISFAHTKPQHLVYACKACKNDKKKEETEKEVIEKIEGACNMDKESARKLKELDASIKESQQRAKKLAKREQERLALLESAEQSWRDLDHGYQKRLQAQKDKEDDYIRQIRLLMDERDTYKSNCAKVAPQLKELSQAVEGDKKIHNELEKEVVDSAVEKHKIQEKAAESENQANEQSNKIEQMNRDQQYQEEQAKRKIKSLEGDVDSMRAISMETERAQREELRELRSQTGETTQKLLKADTENNVLKNHIDEIKEEKKKVYENYIECKTMWDKSRAAKFILLQEKRQKIQELQTKSLECSCKNPVEVSIQVQRTPSLAVLCRCSPDAPIPKSCSCSSMRTKLLSSTLFDLFNGLHMEFEYTGINMPCNLLMCLADKHNWDKSTPLKTNLRNYFARLLRGELDHAIVRAIEKYHAKWVSPSCADIKRNSPENCPFCCDSLTKTQKRAFGTRTSLSKRTLPKQLPTSLSTQTPDARCHDNCCKPQPSEVQTGDGPTNTLGTQTSLTNFEENTTKKNNLKILNECGCENTNNDAEKVCKEYGNAKKNVKMMCKECGNAKKDVKKMCKECGSPHKDNCEICEKVNKDAGKICNECGNPYMSEFESLSHCETPCVGQCRTHHKCQCRDKSHKSQISKWNDACCQCSNYETTCDCSQVKKDKGVHSTSPAKQARNKCLPTYHCEVQTAVPWQWFSCSPMGAAYWDCTSPPTKPQSSRNDTEFLKSMNSTDLSNVVTRIKPDSKSHKCVLQNDRLSNENIRLTNRVKNNKRNIDKLITKKCCRKPLYPENHKQSNLGRLNLADRKDRVSIKSKTLDELSSSIKSKPNNNKLYNKVSKNENSHTNYPLLDFEAYLKVSTTTSCPRDFVTPKINKEVEEDKAINTSLINEYNNKSAFNKVVNTESLVSFIMDKWKSVPPKFFNRINEVCDANKISNDAIINIGNNKETRQLNDSLHTQVFYNPRIESSYPEREKVYRNEPGDVQKEIKKLSNDISNYNFSELEKYRPKCDNNIKVNNKKIIGNLSKCNNGLDLRFNEEQSVEERKLVENPVASFCMTNKRDVMSTSHKNYNVNKSNCVELKEVPEIQVFRANGATEYRLKKNYNEFNGAFITKEERKALFFELLQKLKKITLDNDVVKNAPINNNNSHSDRAYKLLEKYLRKKVNRLQNFWDPIKENNVTAPQETDKIFSIFYDDFQRLQCISNCREGQNFEEVPNMLEKEKSY